MRFRTSRTIQGTPDEVYAALEDPERLAIWWGLAGITNTFSICEFRPGGRGDPLLSVFATPGRGPSTRSWE